MSDIVERLRAGHINSVCAEEAAVEIERLQAKLNEVHSRQPEREAVMAAEIERLRARIAHLEQALHQAGDNIELQEAEQRGFERGLAYARRE